MTSLPARLERDFFRGLNSIVEPAVRRGLLSSRFLPTTLIVLESTGYLSGEPRRTPLFCHQLGPWLLVSTARGKRSFWVRNLLKEPAVRVFLGGRELEADAVVIAPGHEDGIEELPSLLRTLAEPLRLLSRRGWAFALLHRY